MLAVSYLLGRPAGVRSVVLSSPCLDKVAWGRDRRAWLAELGREQLRAVECGASGETDSPW
jgi:proline iminopeptidase